jgi:hypothetical protein
MKDDQLQRSTLDTVFRMGVPSAILAVILCGGWRVVAAFGPDLHDFIRSATVQLQVMSDNLPRMEESLHAIATELPSLRDRLEKIETKVDRAIAGSGAANGDR